MAFSSFNSFHSVARGGGVRSMSRTISFSNYNSSTVNGNYTIYAYTSVATLNNAIAITGTTNLPIQIFAVGGGGSGGCDQSGGGGAGGVLQSAITINGSDSISLSVGAGGIPIMSSSPFAVSGSNTTVKFTSNTGNNITCYGGGGGASYIYGPNLNNLGITIANCGSGGGGDSYKNTGGIFNPGSGTAGQGNAGGAPGSTATGTGGGGGGAGAVGVSASNTVSGSGGAGVKINTTLLTYFAGSTYANYWWAGGGGGGGSLTNIYAGNGGKGGGGGGSSNSYSGGVGDTNGINPGSNGLTGLLCFGGAAGENTGGGGGGGSQGSTNTFSIGGPGGSGIILIAVPTIALGVQTQPTTIASIYARYSAMFYNAISNIWVDSTGNGRDIPSSQITNTGLTKVVTSSNGSSNVLIALQGTTSSAVTFTTSQIPQYTLFTVARYTGGANNTIIASSAINWLSGFWGGSAGVAHHETWLTPESNSVYGNNWIISSDSAYLYRANGVNKVTITNVGSTYLPTFGINRYMYNQQSTFQIMDVLIYNSYLSNADILAVESYLSNLYGIPPSISVGGYNTVTATGSYSQTNNGNNTIYTFTSTGTITFSKCVGIQVLVVGGGGGGGADGGGGGGGGGVVYNSNFVTTPGTVYNITIGAGGASINSTAAIGNSGGNTIFGTITAIGGGGGGNNHNTSAARNGGNGGGRGAPGTPNVSGTYGTGTASQGNNGGDSSDVGSGGGGGGYSSVGSSGTSSAGGNGGNGFQLSITGTSTWYAGGGGGGTWNFSTGGTGGLGGGGNGGTTSTNAGGNATFYGGGGGGSGNQGGSPYSGSGYQGVVIISVSNNFDSSLIPINISGCQLWFDASDPFNNGTVPVNGTTITTWYDKSGSGRNATSSGSTYNTTGINSKPAMTLTGTQNFYGSVPITGNTLTIFAIVTMNSSSTTAARIIGLAGDFQGNSDYSNNSYITLQRGGASFIIQRNSVVVGSTSSTSYSTPYLVECWVDGTNEYVTIQSGSTTNIGSAASTGNFAISAYTIGGNVYGSLNGFISEILVYNTSLTQSDRQKVEGYLSWKWGLQSNLPTTHPYYSNAP